MRKNRTRIQVAKDKWYEGRKGGDACDLVNVAKSKFGPQLSSSLMRPLRCLKLKARLCV